MDGGEYYYHWYNKGQSQGQGQGQSRWVKGCWRRRYEQAGGRPCDTVKARQGGGRTSIHHLFEAGASQPRPGTPWHPMSPPRVPPGIHRRGTPANPSGCQSAPFSADEADDDEADDDEADGDDDEVDEDEE